jgi:hypothetical protein
MFTCNKPHLVVRICVYDVDLNPHRRLGLSATEMPTISNKLYPHFILLPYGHSTGFRAAQGYLSLFM